MKRRPTSKIYHTALYLHRVCGQHTFTARDIHRAMPAACDHYHSLIPDHVLAERMAIFERHDFPGVEYDYTLTEWLSLYPRAYQICGYPTNDIDLAGMNTALRRLFKPYITIDEPYYSCNLTYDQVSNAFKRGYLMRYKRGYVFMYHINPDYVID